VRHGVILQFGRIGLILILPLMLLSGCSSVKPVTESVRFAVLGNTSPDSPFSGFTRSLPAILSEIENRKPQIIIHTGDALYGGSEADGILESDLRRQLNIYFPMLKSLHTAIYTIPGDRDYYNGSNSLYLEYAKRKPSYSFNYGSIHFICLSSSESGESFIDEEQLEWLKNDLNESRDSSAVFVFAHHQLFTDKKKIKISEQKENLHKLFIQYNVRAVFSGAEKDYTSKLKDSVRYINAGCNISTDKNNKKWNRFYVINFSNSEINIDPVK
jgi:3',5'-cyclic AMP phosphodiesterase CpdA